MSRCYCYHFRKCSMPEIFWRHASVRWASNLTWYASIHALKNAILHFWHWPSRPISWPRRIATIWQAANLLPRTSSSYTC